MLIINDIIHSLKRRQGQNLIGKGKVLECTKSAVITSRQEENNTFSLLDPVLAKGVMLSVPPISLLAGHPEIEF